MSLDVGVVFGFEEQLDGVEHSNGASNNYALSYFEPIYSCIDIDAVGGEDS